MGIKAIRSSLAIAVGGVAMMTSVQASAVTVTYAPNNQSNQVSAFEARGNTYTGLAQSVTAVDPRVMFGFYLARFNTSSTLIDGNIFYTLRAGNGVGGTLLKTVFVTAPVMGSVDPTPVMADFSDITLTLGQQYTFGIGFSNVASLPSGAESSTGARYTSTATDVYSGGRFYYVGNDSFNNIPAVSIRDLAFNMVGVTAVPEPASWAMMILGMGAVGGVMRRRKVSTTVKFA